MVAVADVVFFKQERSVKHKRDFGFIKHYYIYMNFYAIHFKTSPGWGNFLYSHGSALEPFGEYHNLSNFQKVRSTYATVSFYEDRISQLSLVSRARARSLHHDGHSFSA